MNPSAASPALRLIRAAALVLPDGTCHRPGAVLLHGSRPIWAGPPGDLPPGVAAATDLPDRLLLPGMVNAHAHLELTAIGPQPYTGSFISWIAMLRERWPGDGEVWTKRPDEVWFATAARQGARLSLDSGVVAVGDITRSGATADAVRDAGLAGVSFIELFGMGPPWDEPALEVIAATGHGLQPHAPYSASPRLFAAAARAGRPVCTHLAETLEEHEFTSRCSGPSLDLLRQLGKWDDAFADAYGRGLSPVQWLRPYLEQARWLVAHCNYVSDEDIRILADTGTSVAYCPIASDYFGHRDHRYREMLDAGVNVCLGTDSIVCQPPASQEPQPLSILAQMRYLYRRDRTDPKLLLRMATTNGRRALQLPDRAPHVHAGLPGSELPCSDLPGSELPGAGAGVEGFFMVRIDPGDPADPLRQVLENREPVEPIVEYFNQLNA